MLALVRVVARPEIDPVHRSKVLIMQIVSVLIIEQEIKIVTMQFHFAHCMIPLNCPEIVACRRYLHIEFDTVFFGAILRQQVVEDVYELEVALGGLVRKGEVIADEEH